MDLKMPKGKHGVLSIIVLTYNREHLLRGCLDSLFSQTVSRENLEIIVVDDGSTDGTGDMMREISLGHPGLKYCRQTHKGIPAARNTGIVNASGDIIAIVADDYLLLPDYAETIIKFFRENPGAMVVRFKIIAAEDDFFSRVSHFYFDVSVRRRLSCEETAGKHWIENMKRKWQKLPVVEEQITTQHDLEAAGGAAFKREAFQIVGLFDESLLRAEDTDMTRRLRAKGILVYYYPYHQIRHRYGRRSVFSTVSKCFATGRNRWRYYNKYSNDSEDLFRLSDRRINEMIDALLSNFWRARQTRSAGQFLLYLPFMFLFETSNKLGFFWSVLQSTIRPRRQIFREEKPKMVIIVDDLGFDKEAIDQLLEISAPISFAVLPNLPYSQYAAQMAYNKGWDVILHLPMEPHSSRHKGVNTTDSMLLVGLPKDEILSKLEKDLASVPYIIGVNNHMGSKFSENGELMELVLKRIKSKGLFFVDSRTSPKTTGFQIAKKLGMKAAERDVFLDKGSRGDNNLRSQIEKLMKVSKKMDMP